MIDFSGRSKPTKQKEGFNLSAAVAELINAVFGEDWQDSLQFLFLNFISEQCDIYVRHIQIQKGQFYPTDSATRLKDHEYMARKLLTQLLDSKEKVAGHKFILLDIATRGSQQIFNNYLLTELPDETSMFDVPSKKV